MYKSFIYSRSTGSGIKGAASSKRPTKGFGTTSKDMSRNTIICEYPRLGQKSVAESSETLLFFGGPLAHRLPCCLSVLRTAKLAQPLSPSLLADVPQHQLSPAEQAGPPFPQRRAFLPVPLPAHCSAQGDRQRRTREKQRVSQTRKRCSFPHVPLLEGRSKTRRGGAYTRFHRPLGLDQRLL